MTRTFVIQGRLCGLNEYINTCRANKYRGNNLKYFTEKSIQISIASQLKGWRTDKKILLNVLWVEPNNKRDRDNVSFAKKFILDAMVHCGTIPDDNPKYVVGFTDNFAIDPKNPKIEVSIEEIQ